MKKRILSMFVVVALTFGVGLQAMGQTNHASITRGSETYYYETFAEIFANNNASLVDGDVVTLLDDETITTGISIYRNVRLNLNGHTLTYTDTQYALTVSSGAEVTITGAEGNTPGGIRCTANGWIILNSGTLTISGGAFSSSNLLRAFCTQG